MSLKEKVYSALMSSDKLTALLAKDRKKRCIYPNISPDAGTYPILVYSVISDVPALEADGEEIERRITVRIHILTKNGVFGAIYKLVKQIMLGLGFVRVQTVETSEKDLFVLTTDFRIGTGVEE